MDKNSLLGLGLIATILGVWLYFSGPTKEQIERNRRIKDSIELVQKKLQAEEAIKIASQQNPRDTIKAAIVVSDSAKQVEVNNKYRDFAMSTTGTKESFIVENEKVKVSVSGKGGQIERVELKDYHRSGKKENLVLFDQDSTRFALLINAYDRSSLFYTDEFYFKRIKQTTNSIVLRLETSIPGSYIEYSYSLKPGEYTVSSEIRFVGMQNIISQTEDQLQLHWSMLYPGQEKYIVKEKEAATIYFKHDINDPDYINPVKDEEKELNEADIKWICFKQQFFNSTIIADKVFNKAGSFIKSTSRPNSENIVKSATAELGIPYTHQTNEKFAFTFYFGPNHYNTLEKQNISLEKIIPTGWSVFSYINKWLVIPLFNWLGNLING